MTTARVLALFSVLFSLAPNAVALHLSPSPPPPVDVDVGDLNMYLWIATAGVTAILALIVGLVAYFCPRKAHSALVLVFAVLNVVAALVATITSVLIALPAGILSSLGTVLAIIGLSVILCDCCCGKQTDRCRFIACGVLTLLSFLLRLLATVYLIFQVLLAGHLFSMLGWVLSIPSLLFLALTAASGLAELLLCIKCFRVCNQAPSNEAEADSTKGGDEAEAYWTEGGAMKTMSMADDAPIGLAVVEIDPVTTLQHKGSTFADNI